MQPKDTGDGLGVVDLAGHRHLYGLRDGEEALGDVLVFFGLGFAFFQAAGEVDVHALVEEAGAGVEEEGFFPFFGSVAGFFEEFAFTADQRRFGAVEASGGEFPEVLAGGVAELADQEDSGLAGGGVEGEDDYRAAVVDDVATAFMAVGVGDVFDGYGEELAFEDGALGEDAGGFLWHFGMVPPPLGFVCFQ